MVRLLEFENRLKKGIIMPAKPDPLTARLFSVEMVAQLVVMVVVISGVWFSLVGKVSANDTGITRVAEKQVLIEVKVNKIQTDIAVILESQKSADRRATRQEQQTQRILDIVQESLLHNGTIRP
jgi:hypothetical protein